MSALIPVWQLRVRICAGVCFAGALFFCLSLAALTIHYTTIAEEQYAKLGDKHREYRRKNCTQLDSEDKCETVLDAKCAKFDPSACLVHLEAHETQLRDGFLPDEVRDSIIHARDSVKEHCHNLRKEYQKCQDLVKSAALECAALMAQITQTDPLRLAHERWVNNEIGTQWWRVDLWVVKVVCAQSLGHQDPWEYALAQIIVVSAVLTMLGSLFLFVFPAAAPKFATVFCCGAMRHKAPGTSDGGVYVIHKRCYVLRWLFRELAAEVVEPAANGHVHTKSS